MAGQDIRHVCSFKIGQKKGLEQVASSNAK